MHLIQQYSLATSSKIDHPSIFESYFPIPFSKYITFQSDAKFESKNYSYFQDVIDFIFPILENLNIKIIQVGVKSEKVYRKVVDLRGQTNFNQLAYIMKNSILHFGPDSLNIHLASVYNIPIVGLYSIIEAKNAGPYFGDKSKQIVFEAFKRIGNGKPSYSPQENPKSINLIKPEEIANAIFKLLNINFVAPYETVFIGKKYGNNIIRELIPNAPIVINNPEQPVEIRADIFYDEKILTHHLSYLKKAVIITDKRIPINLLSFFKKNIAAIVYKVTEKDDEPKFVQELINNGLQVVLLSDLNDELLRVKKINYYEYGNIHKTDNYKSEDLEKFKKDIDKLYFKSCKLIASNNKIYNNYGFVERDIPLINNDEYQLVIDTPDFWKDLEFYLIAKKIS